jgi:hypothetical protein
MSWQKHGKRGGNDEKKELLKSDVDYEVILVDTTKTPVERPKRGIR